MTRYPGAAACILLVLGIILGTAIHLPDFVLFCTTVSFLMAALVALSGGSNRWAKIAAAGCLVFLGVFRYNLLATNSPPNHISRFNDIPEKITVTGRIVGEPDPRPDKTFLTVECDTLVLRAVALPASGLLLIRIDRCDDRFSYADRISVTGYVRAPFERRNFHGFDYRRYLRLKRVKSQIRVKHPSSVRVIEKGVGNRVVSDVVIPLRRYILSIYDTNIYGSERHLIAGFLIGETRFIPSTIYDRFKDTGTLHLLAVSGSNVALVIVTSMFLFRVVGVPRRLVDILSLPVIALFCQLSFNQPSVVRASLMIGLVLIARVLYRRANLPNIMAVTAFLILLYDPLMLFDVGFQLSFAATFSLICFLKGLMPRLRRHAGWTGWLRDYGWVIILSSIVVQLTVAPILAYNFGAIPLITFISNLVVIPLSSIAVVLSVLLVLAAPLPVLSDVVAVAAQISLHLSIRLVDLFASFPVVKLSVAAPSPIHIALYYAVLIAFFSVLKNHRNLRYLVLLILIWGNVIIWKELAARNSRSPEITFLDVGRNAALHLHIPPGYDMMAANSAFECDHERLDRVIKPYLTGEGITGIDRWEVLALPDGSPGCGPDSGENSFAADLVRTDVSDRQENDCFRIRLYKSQSGIEIASIDFGSRAAVWLSDWELLDGLDSAQFGAIEILALPHPYAAVSNRIAQIYRLGPQTVVIYNSPAGRWQTDFDFLAARLKSVGIRLIGTQKHGAVRFRLDPEKTDVTFSAAGS